MNINAQNRKYTLNNEPYLDDYCELEYAVKTYFIKKNWINKEASICKGGTRYKN